jgi:hypothetical protein
MGRSPRIEHWDGALENIYVHSFNKGSLSTAISIECVHETDKGLPEDFTLWVDLNQLIGLRNQIDRILVEREREGAESRTAGPDRLTGRHEAQ